MDFVTGLLASYINPIAATDLVSGVVTGSNRLTMKKRNGTTIDAGLIVNLTTYLARATALEPNAGDGLWHFVGAAGEPAFGTGIVNYGSGKQTLRFRRDKSIVTLDGCARTSVVTRAQTIFTLPTGFRPTMDIIGNGIASMTTGVASAGTAHVHDLGVSTCRITITSAGVVSTQGPNNFNGNSIISLTGFTFRTDG